MSQEKLDMSTGFDSSTVSDYVGEIANGSVALFDRPLNLMHEISDLDKQFLASHPLASRPQLDGTYDCADDVLPSQQFLQLDSFVYAMLYSDLGNQAKPAHDWEDFIRPIKVNHVDLFDNRVRVPDIGRNSPCAALRLSATILRRFTEGNFAGSDLVLRSGDAMPFRDVSSHSLADHFVNGRERDDCEITASLYEDVMFSQKGELTTMQYMVDRDFKVKARRADAIQLLPTDDWRVAAKALRALLQMQVSNLYQAVSAMTDLLRAPFNHTSVEQWSDRLERVLLQQVRGVYNFWTMYAVLGYLFVFDTPIATTSVWARVPGLALSSNLLAWNRFLTDESR